MPEKRIHGESRFTLDMIFPVQIRTYLTGSLWREGLEEIRIRIGQPVEFCYGTASQYLCNRNGTAYFLEEWKESDEEKEVLRTTAADIAEILNYISNYSLYAYQEEIRQGFLTIQGGHRIGLAGSVVVEDGKIMGIHHITFLNVRVAQEKKGCALEILPYIRNKGSIYNTLFVSPPGGGKTTFLRDTVRLISKGDEKNKGLKVCVVDERSEIAACYRGVPQNDLGPHTDVLSGCPKTEGMILMLRSMSPQVLAVDELGTDEDFWAVEQAACSGSRVLGTVHAEGMGDILIKPHIHKWMEQGLFERFVCIRQTANGERECLIYNREMERIG